MICTFSNERNFTFISVNVNVLLQKGFSYIQDCVDDTSTVKDDCMKCKNSCDTTETYGTQIMIDTSILADPNYLQDIGMKIKPSNLHEISKQIIIQGIRYILRGVINYMNNMHHYNALLFTGTKWYEYDDLKPKRIEISPTKYEVVPHVLLYVRAT